MNKEFSPQNTAGEHLDFSPEKNSNKLESISSVEEEVFRRLVPKLHDLRIKMDEFDGVYSKEEIERDKQSVERKKASFDNSDSPSHKRAQILEALLAEQIELSDWLGEDAMTIVPTEYDDLYHGVDLATEFQRNDTLQYLAIGVDVTTSRGPALNSKLSTIKENIEKGNLTEMKYFASERLPDFHGRMANIPSLIIGADARTITELSDLWLKIDKSKSVKPEADPIDKESLREQAREAQQKLAHHRAQVLILKQMEIQLDAFGHFARRKGHEEIANKFDKLLAFIRETLKNKTISKVNDSINESDDVLHAIRENLEKLF